MQRQQNKWPHAVAVGCRMRERQRTHFSTLVTALRIAWRAARSRSLCIALSDDVTRTVLKDHIHTAWRVPMSPSPTKAQSVRMPGADLVVVVVVVVVVCWAVGCGFGLNSRALQKRPNGKLSQGWCTVRYINSYRNRATPLEIQEATTCATSSQPRTRNRLYHVGRVLW